MLPMMMDRQRSVLLAHHYVLLVLVLQQIVYHVLQLDRISLHAHAFQGNLMMVRMQHVLNAVIIVQVVKLKQTTA